jgi:hypothetical protein
MINRLIEIGGCYGVEMNVKTTKVMRISRYLFLVQIRVDQKQLQNVKRFNYLGCTRTNNARCTREIKSRIALEKAAFNREQALVTSKLDLNLRKKLVKCYTWSIPLYGAETCTLRKAD